MRQGKNNLSKEISKEKGESLDKAEEETRRIADALTKKKELLFERRKSALM